MGQGTNWKFQMEGTAYRQRGRRRRPVTRQRGPQRTDRKPVPHGFDTALWEASAKTEARLHQCLLKLDILYAAYRAA